MRGNWLRRLKSGLVSSYKDEAEANKMGTHGSLGCKCDKFEYESSMSSFCSDVTSNETHTLQKQSS